MNYGRYFRLNRSVSQIEKGIAIYDYIDLPAYFSPSEDNKMSPKYPISVNISSSSVYFRLHYNAFKIEEGSGFKNKNYPFYTYSSDDFKIKDEVSYKSGDNVKIAHMEEVILELPFHKINPNSLSNTIKNIYNSTFPQVVDKTTSMGGRFLEIILQKRYPGSVKTDNEISKQPNDIKLYHNLQTVSDTIDSYSTLWLMDLVKDGCINLYQEHKIKPPIDGFLRKLLLDFMFDLKHSDVFQNSANYQQMYSGLMSDFYFSALMHKCEYYYYRRITSKAIEDFEETTLSKKEKKERKKAITSLYAYELIKAEDLWIHDIMNPQAEKEFEHKYPGKHNLLRDIFEYYSFKQWPSWFAEPEEEMRRVCFTMKDETGEKHICNSDTLVRYLKLQAKGEEASIVKMIELRNDGKEKISKWFLKQYAFSDVLHLHFFKHANSLLLLLLAIPLLLSLFLRGKLIDYYFYYLLQEAVVVFAIFAISFVVGWIEEKTSIRSTTKSHYHHKKKNTHIVNTRKNTIIERGVLLLIILTSIIFVLFKEYNHDRLPKIPLWVVWVVPVSILLYVILKRRRIKGVLPEIIRDMISCLHLFLPRLVASITLAWFTLSMGFDLYVSYFDASPQTGYIIGICVIVTLFVMFSINKVIPHSPPLRKLLRSLELMIISYFISLSVGFVIINFLGEIYLERGGYISEYYTQYVENEGVDYINRFIRINGKLEHQNIGIDAKLDYDSIGSNCVSYAKMIVMKMDSTSKSDNDSTCYSKKLSSDLINVYHSEVKDGKLRPIHPVAAKISFWGMEFFILRDFLIMFAFIAMFTGIFIQLIIFGDNKQMTEL